MQVAVGPAEDRLESIVDAAQRNGARNLDAPPDRRVDFEQDDFELLDRGLDLGGGHQSILSFKCKVRWVWSESLALWCSQ